MTLSAPAISPAAPRLNRYFKQAGASNLSNQTYNVLSTFGDYGKKFGSASLSIFSFLGGLAGIVGGSVGATFFKDNTSADWLSKLAIIGGTILSGKGVYELIQFTRTRNDMDLPDAHFKVNQTLERDLSNSLPWVNSNPDSSLKISQGIVNNTSDTNLRARANEVFNLWTNNEFKNIVSHYNGGAEITIDNGAGINTPISLKEYKDRLAMLIGYIVGSTPVAPSADDFTNKLTTTIMKDDEVVAGNCELFKLLPDEFNLVYSAARYYDKSHKDEDSIQNEFASLVGDLEPMKVVGEGPAKQTAWDKLRGFEKASQNLKVLSRAIEYVLEAENKEKEGTIDPQSKRNAAVIRQALVAGLGLRGNNIDEIHQALKIILNRYEPSAGTTKKGINDRLSELRGIQEQVKQKIDDGTFVCCRLQSAELKFDSIFPADADYFEFKEVSPH